MSPAPSRMQRVIRASGLAGLFLAVLMQPWPATSQVGLQPVEVPTISAAGSGALAGRTATQSNSVKTTSIDSRLRADLRFLSADQLGGRATGSKGNERARHYLVARLEALHATPFFDEDFCQTFPIKSTRSDGQEGHNVVALFPSSTPSTPSAPTPLLVVSAHYDHLGVRNHQVFNGADDNASGVSALLEIGRRLAVTETASDIVLGFLDAEELGLLGAHSLVERLGVERMKQVSLNINLDMIGRSDGKALFASGLSHNPALRPLMETIAKRSPIPLKFGHDTGAGSNNWTLSSDHAAFYRAGVPFIYFGVEDHVDYHRPTDDFERIDFSFLQGATDVVFQTILAFDKLSRPQG